MQTPIRMVQMEWDNDCVCFFCGLSLPEPGEDGIIWYRAEQPSGKWGTVCVCEHCWLKDRKEQG